ncbi:MAG: DNA topoisomerase VI subunit B [Candidatus Diapherotrites archaeon]|uniref:Type 2 DNA topoisomerase 6 subunit B n=1 Tax=Candidatus Iainarchaeum sp. TaxID=3101447 RepID=A0A8T3YMJ2_9ARCH|nr:DNA topoisomerase VI subunit B [Candidatus Diapherotrites archaeon]
MAEEEKGAESEKGLSAEEIAKEFKEHSVAEFFKKNMQMLGLTGKIKTLTTIVHEYCTNSVTGDTPTVTRKDGEVMIEKIGTLIGSLMENNGFEYSQKNEAESLRDFQKFEVLCFDKQTNNLKFKEVQSIHRHKMGLGEKIFRIKTVGGRTVEATRHHGLFSLRNGKIVETKAGELNVGDYLVAPRKPWIEETRKEINILEHSLKLSNSELGEFSIYGVKDLLYENKELKDKIKSQLGTKEKNLDFYRNYMKCDRLPLRLLKVLNHEELKFFVHCKVGSRHSKYMLPTVIPISKELMRFLGFYIAEGSTRKTMAESTLSFGAHEKEHIEYSKFLAEQVFGLKPIVKNSHRTAINVVMPSRTLSFVLTKIFKCGLGARNKKIPSIVFSTSKELSREFLFAYLAGDGYPSKTLFDSLIRGNFDIKQKITMATASQELSTGLQYLLSGLGYSYSFCQNKPEKRVIAGKLGMFGESYTIEFYTNQKNSPLNFYPLEIGGVEAIVEPKLKWAINKRGQQIASYEKIISLKLKEASIPKDAWKFISGDLGLLQITSVEEREPEENEYVYDYSVEGDENFVGGYGAFCLHNSLDACEEAKILPDIEVQIKELGDEYYEVTVKDNGPGLTQETVGKALGKLLAGTKFHRMMQLRGQQGIGACMKSDTLVPLADGRVMAIREIVDKNMVNEGALSIDLKTLKVCRGKIVKCWKVKNPYFVKLKTAKGLEISLTPENPVLTVKNGALEWIRADEAEKGTKIAAPNKIFAFTNSKRTLDIFDSAKIQVDEPKFMNEIKTILMGKYGSINAIAQRFGVKKDTARNWFSRKMPNGNTRGRITFEILKKMAHDAGFSEEEIYQRISRIGRNGTFSKIPVYIEAETAWIAGLIAGDGHMSSEKDDKWGVNVTFTNKNKKLIGEYKSIIEKKFGLKTQTYLHDTKKYYTVQCSSKVLSEIFEFFGVKRGKKSDCFVLSDGLFSQNEEIIAAYLKGLFDAEGSVSVEKRTITLTLYNKCAIEQVFHALLRIGIHASINKDGNQKRISITEKENIYRFLEKVGLSDESKADKVIRIINSGKQNTQTDTIPGINRAIESEVRRMQLPLTVLPSMSYSAIHSKNVSRRALKQAIQVINLQQENWFLHALANAEVSWLEVVETKLEKNTEEFVYDLEIEEHHNFIAGGIICHNSGATMLSQITTGKATSVLTGTGKGKPFSAEITIDPKKNEPKLANLTEIAREFHGTIIKAKFKGVKYVNSEQAPLEYLRRTAIANPHAQITLIEPSGEKTVFKRTLKDIPGKPTEMKPHPKGVTIDDLVSLAKYTDARKVDTFLKNTFDRLGDKAIEELAKGISFDLKKDPRQLTWEEAEEIVKQFKKITFIAPRTDGLIPIGEDRISKSLKNIVNPEFLAVITRKPTVYSGGFPFQVEVGIAYGGEAGRMGDTNEEGVQQKKIEIMRFANRAPLLFDTGGCAITKAVQSIDWKRYGMRDYENAPLTIFVNLISVHIPYTSAGKQAISDEDEIMEELRLALMESGRKIYTYIGHQRRQAEKEAKRKMFYKYASEVAGAVADLTGKVKKEIEGKLHNLVLRHLKLEEQKEKQTEEKSELSEEEIEKDYEKHKDKEKKNVEKNPKKKGRLESFAGDGTEGGE